MRDESPNLLERQFGATTPDRRRVSDFPCLRAAEGWLYVAAVPDRYSRRVVGWPMRPNLTAQPAIDAPMMASWRRGKPVAPMHRFDRGSQYASEDFQRLPADQGIAMQHGSQGGLPG